MKTTGMVLVFSGASAESKRPVDFWLDEDDKLFIRWKDTLFVKRFNQKTYSDIKLSEMRSEIIRAGYLV